MMSMELFKLSIYKKIPINLQESLLWLLIYGFINIIQSKHIYNIIERKTQQTLTKLLWIYFSWCQINRNQCLQIAAT